MTDLGHAALGAWSGGRFLHYGVTLDDARLIALLRPDERVRTVVTADVYGEGEADRLVGRAIDGLERASFRLVGAVGHDFVDGERDGPRGYPRFTDPRLRGPGSYGAYLRRATEASLARCGVDRFDLLLLHNPDRIGYTSEEVWSAHGRPARRGARRLDRRRTRPCERLHARPDRLSRALRRADRLGDADPEPVRALAGAAGAARGRPARRRRCSPGSSTTAGSSTTRSSTSPSSSSPTTGCSGRRAGSRRGGHGSTSCVRSPAATTSRCSSSPASGRSRSPRSPASSRR